jgi:5-methylcytosine-specific restriction endonuclease McrA
MATRPPDLPRGEHNKPPRPNAHQRGYTRQWQKIRKQVLASEVFCRYCVGPRRFADQVHHIDHNTRNNHRDNLAPICTPCHMKLHKAGLI